MEVKSMPQPASQTAMAEDLAQIKRLRLVSLIEATTLLLLLVIAVPLKHAFGYALVTRIMGPVHGAAFIAYSWSVIATVSGGGWSRSEIARLGFGAFVPFGGFLNAGLLRRKQMNLAAGQKVSP
jgi:integral membrane protein